MLNLSDKELDRLSREAAQEHDPGDPLGPGAWDKLEIRLDGEFGRVNPNLFGRLRRLPFYYTPAVLLLIGVATYFIRQGNHARQGEPSGSPPLTKAAPPKPNRTNPAFLSQNSNDSTNSTSAPSATATVEYPGSPSPGTSGSSANPAATVVSSSATKRSTAAAGSDSTAGSPAAARSTAATRSASTAGSAPTAGSPAAPPAPSSHSTPAAGSPSLASDRPNAPARDRTASLHHPTGHPGSAGTHTLTNDNNIAGTIPTRNNTPVNHNARSGSHHNPGKTVPGNTDALTRESTSATKALTGESTSGTNGSSSGSPNNGNGHNTSSEAALSRIQRPRSLKGAPFISDSALRKVTAIGGPIKGDSKKSLHISRALLFGASIAPDFSSVRSLAGDKPGSTFGLTLNYQFANHWYIGTGLLYSRKNYSARAQDFHAPKDYYRANNLNNIDFVKGSLSMLEIPLNLRYDFSVTGNTMFFASAGASSYLLSSEDCNYYFPFFGREDCLGFKYPDHHNYLLSAINLSLGVETGISNSLSLLVAPYIKIPSRNIGFGQVQMSSVGINFALQFAPIISRKRR